MVSAFSGPGQDLYSCTVVTSVKNGRSGKRKGKASLQKKGKTILNHDTEPCLLSEEEVRERRKKEQQALLVSG